MQWRPSIWLQTWRQSRSQSMPVRGLVVGKALAKRNFGYNSMTRITNTILSPNIPNPQSKIYLNGRLTLTLITPNRPSRCVSWNYNRNFPVRFCTVHACSLMILIKSLSTFIAGLQSMFHDHRDLCKIHVPRKYIYLIVFRWNDLSVSFKDNI